MGRHAIKSKEKIVDTCTKLFWKQGYKNTSVKDIEVATQLNNGSIYHFFNNKTNLFEQTLDHYFVNVIKPRVDKYLLTDEGDAYNNICSFYSSSLSTKPKQRPGCLAVNTTIESHINIATQNKLVSFNKVLEDGFYYQLNRICTLKPKSTSEIRKRAKLLTLSNHGFFCMMKLGNNDEELRDYIESIVLSIKWER